MSDVDVVIRAKNITQEAFKQVQSALAELEGKAKSTGNQTKSLSDHVTGFFSSHKESFQTLGTAFAGAAAGVAAVTAGIVALGVHGADVSDMRGSFNDLNKTIGNDGPLVLKTLRTAFAGTVSDMELMKLTNKALSAGVRASATDFGTVADAARVLSDRGLGPATEMFDTLTKAMSTGKLKQAELLIGHVDETKALEDYAKKLGTTTSKLTESEKASATAAAVVARLREETLANGKAQFDFADGVDAATTMVANFKDRLGEAIATSPVVISAMTGIQKAITNALGEDQEAQVRSLTGMVNKFAIFLVDVAQTGVTAADFIGRGWNALQMIFAASMAIVSEVGVLFTNVVAGAAELAAKLPGVGGQFRMTALAARETADVMGAVQKSFYDQAQEALAGVKGNSKLTETLGKVHASLGGVRKEMVAASKETPALTTETGNVTTAFKKQAEAARLSTDDLKKLKESIRDIERGTPQAAFRVVALDQALQGVGRTVDVNSKGMISMGKLVDRLKEIETPSQQATFEVKSLSDALNLLGSPKVPAAFTALPKFAEALKASVGDLPKIMMQAFTGGGGMDGAIKALGTNIGIGLFDPDKGAFAKAAKTATAGLSGVFGKTIGGALGAAIPGIGALIGPALGAVWSGIKKLFGGPSEAELAGRSLVAQFEQQVAGVLSAGQKLEAGNVSWKMTTIAVRDAYLATGRSAQQAEQDVEALWQSAKGGPEGAKVAIEKVNAAFREQQQDQANLTAAVEKYGFTIEQLGPAMQRQRLTETVGQLMTEYTALAGSGINLSLVHEKMAGNLNAYVQQAISMGQEVPAAMRPILEQMIQNGTLLDANGVKVEALEGSGITFAETFSTALKPVVDRLQLMLESIGAVPKKLAQIPNSLPDPFAGWKTPEVVNKVRGGFGGLFGGDDEGETSDRRPSFKGGGIGDFGAGTAAILHGTEAIIPMDRPSAIGSALTQNIAQTVVQSTRGSNEGRLSHLEGALAMLARSVANMPTDMVRQFRDASLVGGRA